MLIVLEVGLSLGLNMYAAELASSARNERQRAEDALTAAKQKRDEAKARLDRLIFLYETVSDLPVEKIADARDEFAAAKAFVAEAEAALDKAKLADPMADIGSLRTAEEALTNLPPEQHAEARAAMHEKLKRLVTRVDVSADGYMVHYADGTWTRGARLG